MLDTKIYYPTVPINNHSVQLWSSKYLRLKFDLIKREKHFMRRKSDTTVIRIMR